MPDTETVTGATTTEAAPASVSEGSPSSTPSSSDAASTPTPSKPAESAKGFRAELQKRVENAGTTTPAAGQPPAVSRGPIPYDRHEAVLNKAREDAKAEREAAIAQARAESLKQYGLEPNTDPAQLQRQLQTIAQMRANPVAFLQQLATEIQQDPTHGPTMRSWAGQALSTGRADGQAADPMPEPDLQTETGQKLYSDARMAEVLKWQTRQTLAAVRQENAPFQQTVESIEQMRREASAQRDAQTWSREAFGAVAKLEGFEQNQAAIAERMKAFQWPQGVSVAEGRSLMHVALLNAYNEIVLPQLTELGRKKAMADLEKRAQSSTRSPQNTGAGTPTKKAKDGTGFAAQLAERMSR